MDVADVKQGGYIMVYKILLLVLLCCSFRAFSSLTANYIQEVKEVRKQNEISFDFYVRDVKNCIRVSNTVSTEFVKARDQYKTRVARVQELCGNHFLISGDNKYISCMSAVLALKREPEYLIRILSERTDICPQLNLKKTIQDLKDFITTLEESFSTLEKRRTEFIINNFHLQRAEERKKNTTQQLPARCNMGVLSDFKQLLFLDTSAMFRSEFGDSYGFEKNLKIMNMLKDKVSITVKVCKLGNLSDKVIESKQIIQKVKNKFGKSFDEFAQKACSLLDKSPQNNLLCETPLNNDSWKYSVSQALQKQMGYKVR